MRWSALKYKNLLLFLLGMVVALVLTRVPAFHAFLIGLSAVPLLAAFVGGLLFVLMFTVSTGVVILSATVGTTSLIVIAAVAGAGAVVGDLIIFKAVRNDLSLKVEAWYERFRGSHLGHLLSTRYFQWTLPVIGALIIASPLPDELGVSLMGISKIKTINFVLLSWILNTVGIFLILGAVSIAS